MSDWYENYKNNIKEQASKLDAPKKDAAQHLLWLKAAVIKKVEDAKIEGAYTFKAEDKFGFSELLVNQLMQYAFDAGAKGINEKSMDMGYDAARTEIAEKLGFSEHENED